MEFEDMINTIQLGDCYELIKKIPDKSIDLVYIDIPYLSKNMEKGAGDIKNKLSYMGTKTRVETFLKIGKLMDVIDYSIFDELCRIMKNIYIYIYGVAKSKFWIL